ncbi:MAG: M14 family metallocarboxypeptidase [bacterium]|nr:M14 family metallocarboxypeptidase [bacterium]
MSYDYTQLTNDINLLTQNFNFIESFSIGESIMEKPIPCLRIGKGSRKILLAGAFHGLEYLTAAFLIKFTSDYAAHILGNTSFFGYDTAEIHKNTSVYLVPMVNPDGVDIAVNGIDITNPHHRALISMTGIHSFNLVWQSNARGVDLNHNYDAKWSMVVEECAPTKYGGEYPESEPETRAVTNLIRNTDFDTLLAFHSQGREIYYDFDGLAAEKSRRLAEQMASESGYALKSPAGTAAFGGCKDWFIKEYGKSGFTVEIGFGKNPLPMSQLDKIYEENARLTLCALNGSANKQERTESKLS